MLPPFQIRNLRSPIQPNTSAAPDSFVRISAPAYDKTISNHTTATLKYQDDEQDTITIGSSSELVSRLEEPVPRQSGKAERASRNPMAIATMLAEEQKPAKAEHHVFDVDDSPDVKGVWKSIQAENNPKPSVLPAEMVKAKTIGEDSDPKRSDLPARESSQWTPEEDALILQQRGSGMTWTEIKDQLPGRPATSCRLHYEAFLWNESGWTDEGKKNKLAEVYERYAFTRSPMSPSY